MGGLLALVLVGAGAIYVGQYIHTPLPNPSQIASTAIPTTVPMVSPTTNWKTYSNARLGFSIQIPPQETVTESATNSSWVWIRLEDLGLIIANDPPQIGDPAFLKKVRTQTVQLSNGASIEVLLYQRGNTSFEKDGLSNTAEVQVGKNATFNPKYYIDARFPIALANTNFGAITQILSTFKFAK